jgi:hypothetical protein
MARKRRAIVVRTRRAIARDSHGVISLLVGGIAGFLINTEMVKQSDWLKRHWYALPIAMLLVGYFLARRGNAHGRTLMALGGFLFMQGFMNRPAESEAKSGETGAPGALPEGQWVVTPDGQRVLVPAWQWQRYEDAAGQVVNEIYNG